MATAGDRIEEVRERGRRLADAQRLSRVGSWNLDLATQEFTCSEELCRLFDLGPRSDVTVGEALRRVGHDHRRTVADAVTRCISTGEPFVVEYPVNGRDGTCRWVVTRGELIVDEAGVARRAHGTVQDVTDARMVRETVDQLTFHDPLTGLGNRLLLDRQGPAILARGARNGWTDAVLVIDIDRLHEINEAIGLRAGDEVLIETARRLQATFRPYDLVVRSSEIAGTVARFGGDVFVVLCENVGDRDTAGGLCRRLAAALDERMVVGSQDVEVSVSIGVALIAPGVDDLTGQIIAAEAAMRHAKTNGGNRYEHFLPHMLDSGGGRRSTEVEELHEALAGGELRLVFQPKIALDGRGMVGVEALLRWQHPERGMVSPAEFIPLAERSGVIVAIGTWVIEEACDQASRWRRSFPSQPLVVSVNVSAVQLGAGLVGTVQEALKTHGVPASMLRLELTESVLMDDVEGAIRVLSELEDMGVTISVDDFGTGHSSLAYLQRLPLHEVKVDRSFVAGLGADKDSTAIVAAVVAMSHALGLTVVAEGVENEAQLEHLRVLGCDEVQGYHLGRPTPAGSIDEQLRAAEAIEGAPGVGDRGAGSNRAPRVLIVDDADDVRQLARMSLAAAGFDVQEAASGPEAVIAAGSWRPSCVLLDVDMPGLSGIEVCRTLREQPAMSACTIVMLSSKADADDKVDAFSNGADDYIVKPFTPRDLTGRVRAAMERRSAQTVNPDRPLR